MLSQTDRDRISAAVASAERTTAAEIVVLVAARAGAYRSIAVLAALLVGLAVPWLLIAATRWSASAIALAQAIVVLVALLATLDQRVRLALVPRAIRRARAHEAALREFAARGVAGTRGRTGVLIYLAAAEGHAEIVADHAVAGRVPVEAWSAAIVGLLTALRGGRTTDGLLGVVSAVGTILAKELPGSPDDTDELPNRVIVTD